MSLFKRIARAPGSFVFEYADDIGQSIEPEKALRFFFLRLGRWALHRQSCSFRNQIYRVHRSLDRLLFDDVSRKSLHVKQQRWRPTVASTLHRHRLPSRVDALYQLLLGKMVHHSSDEGVLVNANLLS